MDTTKPRRNYTCWREGDYDNPEVIPDVDPAHAVTGFVLERNPAGVTVDWVIHVVEGEGLGAPTAMHSYKITGTPPDLKVVDITWRV